MTTVWPAASTVCGMATRSVITSSAHSPIGSGQPKSDQLLECLPGEHFRHAAEHRRSHVVVCGHHAGRRKYLDVGQVVRQVSQRHAVGVDHVGGHHQHRVAVPTGSMGEQLLDRDPVVARILGPHGAHLVAERQAALGDELHDQRGRQCLRNGRDGEHGGRGDRKRVFHAGDAEALDASAVGRPHADGDPGDGTQQPLLFDRSP
jgi:hypothetical protein